jgi:hypothetical protein
MYAKVTELIEWKHVYKWLLQRINRLKPFKTSQDMSGCLWFFKCLFNHSCLERYVVGGCIYNQ